jgi:hypothetical protein
VDERHQRHAEGGDAERQEKLGAEGGGAPVKAEPAPFGRYFRASA